MYTLREIKNSNGVETNYKLGNCYHLIDCKKSPEEFERTKEFCKHVDAKSPKTFAFIVSENGGEIHPIHEAYSHYIMTESGKTFSTIKKL